MQYTIHFFDGIEPGELETFSQVVAKAESGDSVTIEFCNGGGSVFHGIAICDMMASARLRGVTFTSNVWGYAASAACLVALSADHVFMSPNAAIMYHSAWSPSGGDNPGIAVANSVQQKLLAGRISKISEKDFSDGDEHWVTADAAHDLGIIDGFIGNGVNREDSENIRLAARYIYSGGKPMKKTEKLNAEVEAVKAEAPCNEEEKKNEETKALDDDVMTVSVLEQIVQRLDEIEKRLSVLEGEGKKADDEGASDGAENGDQIAARLNQLYAKLTEKPVVANISGNNASASKKTKMEASFERSKKIDLKSFV